MANPQETNWTQVAAERLLQSYYLALFDRVMPLEYLATLKSPGPGYELLQAFAKVAERLSLAVARTKVNGYIGSAVGQQKSQVTVRFVRTSGGSATTIKAGTVVRASSGERDFVLLSDVSFSAADNGPHDSIVQAVAAGYEWNVAGPATTAAGSTLPGVINTIFKLITDPVFADTTFTVTQVDTADGGQPQWLDQHGADRALPRASGESDAAYRLRILSLPDTVSPGAMQRAISATFAPYGVAFDFIETFELRYQTCWDAPGSVIPANPSYDPNLFVYDDPRSRVPFRNRWLDEVEYRAAFIVVVPRLLINNLGMAYDDTATGPSGLLTTTGGRAVGAYDVPSTFAAARQGAYDGLDVGLAALYLGLYNLLQQIKAGGVTAVLELEGN